MLIGEYNHSLDAKGRTNFPSKLREDIGDHFIITKGLDNCLSVYSLEEWAILEQKTSALPMAKSVAIKRFLFASASELECDKQGRVLIPQSLRSYAGLERDITIVGLSNRIEIWDKDRWEQKVLELTSELIAETMEDVGF